MTWQTIAKTGRDVARLTPNLQDYEHARRTFTWEGARKELDGLPDAQGLNIAYEAVDRHANGPRRDHLAIRWLGKNSEIEDCTYSQLKTLTNRFANVLQGLGVNKGDRVYILAGRIPELYVAALGTLKHGGVFCPLFSAFGPEPIRARLTIGQAKVLITTELLYDRKVKALRPSLPFLEHVVLIGSNHQATNVPNTKDYFQLMENAGDSYTIRPTAPEDLALLHFTSGTTGTPKGAVHVHGAVIAHHITGKLALDFHNEDIFWCTADPGWVTGTSYGIIAPLTNGITSIVDEADFDAERWCGILQSQKVSVWYSAPTAIRMLMKVGSDRIGDASRITTARQGNNRRRRSAHHDEAWARQTERRKCHCRFHYEISGNRSQASARRKQAQFDVEEPIAGRCAALAKTELRRRPALFYWVEGAQRRAACASK